MVATTPQATTHYVQAALKFKKRYGATVVLLATDSDAALREFVAEAADRFRVVVQVVDRVAATGADLPSLGKHAHDTAQFIESRNARGELDRAATFASIVADLEALRTADALVATSNSWVSRLVFLLMLGDRGVVPPHAFLDRRFGAPADVW